MAPKGDPPSTTERPPLEDVAGRVAALIDRGLRRYGKGDLDGALGEWELALALDPEAKAAEDYITYVRENFEQLSQSFQAEKEIVEQVRAEGIPVPDDEVNEDEFPEIEITDAGTSNPKPGLDLDALHGNGPALNPRLSHEIQAVDEGWELDDVSVIPVQLPAPYTPPVTSGGMPIVTVKPRPKSEVPLEEALLAGGATTDDFEYSDLHAPPHAGSPGDEIAARAETIREAPHHVPQELDDQAGTDAVPFQGALPEEGFASDDADAGLDDDAQTQARPGQPYGEGGDSEGEYVSEFKDELSDQHTAVLPPTDSDVELQESAPGLGGPPPPLDYDSVVEFVAPGSGPRKRPTLEPAHIVHTASAKPQNLNDLFLLAREAAERNDFAGAVQAVEMYYEKDPDLKFLDTREKEIFMRIYEGHLGRMDQVPLVAVPMHEISAANLDHRTGFLLSRIDGMLTFEDILDVAGMPRVEAYRILASLLRRGFIDVR